MADEFDPSMFQDSHIDDVYPLFGDEKDEKKDSKSAFKDAEEDETQEPDGDTPVGLPKGLGVSSALGAFFKQNKFADVTFVCTDDKDDKKKDRVGAHRVILAARSPVFEAMLFPVFEAQKKEEKDVKEIELKGIKAGIFRTALQSLYTGRTEITPENITELTKLAKKYQIQCLRHACESFLKNGVTVANACLWLSKSAPGSTEKKAALTFIEDNTSKVIQSEGLLDLRADDLSLICKSNQLDIDEIELWNAVCHWTDSQIEKGVIKDTADDRRKLLKDIYPYIRFPIMSMEQLISKVAPTRIVPPDHLLAIYSYVGAKESTRVKFELHYETKERNPRKPSSHFVWDSLPSGSSSSYSSSFSFGTTARPTGSITDGGLVATSNGSGWITAYGLVEWRPKTGIYEWEYVLEQYDTTNTYNVVVGVVPTSGSQDTSLKTIGPIAYSGQPGWGFITGQGQIIQQHSAMTYGTNYSAQCKQGDRVGVRLNTDTGRLNFYRNGVQVTGQTLSVTQAVRPALSMVQNQRVRLNFKCKLPKPIEDRK